jgi:hypothetical protein
MEYNLLLDMSSRKMNMDYNLLEYAVEKSRLFSGCINTNMEYNILDMSLLLKAICKVMACTIVSLLK